MEEVSFHSDMMQMDARFNAYTLLLLMGLRVIHVFLKRVQFSISWFLETSSRDTFWIPDVVKLERQRHVEMIAQRIFSISTLRPSLFATSSAFLAFCMILVDHHPHLHTNVKKSLQVYGSHFHTMKVSGFKHFNKDLPI